MPLYSLDGHRPQIADRDRLWIAPDAHVIGHVKFGRDVGIWFGAVVRADDAEIVIGDRSNIQDNAVLHVDPGFPLRIGAGVTVGHKAIVHGCTIGPDTLIGMGATVLTGARIGSGCLVGANALVKEKAEFPDRSLIVGAPARAVRQLSEAEVARLRGAADHYVENARRFRAGLARLD
ncbi:gamma carbonic anhydrase family protein [Jatrophihabitans endophyticus]|uniref:gamma carbonic anhydrase family protein n=1 Tax=Jatrophihabitans endophyticus TaxID=1206085 RepID=UPI001A095323|nr:gamma carbonic anhydrase family protein [Jatrophihabitans endophyticus]MBE7189998.1 gamma carbonic anhydrase family protein [Jatrophihabitans endophyticus]